MKAKQFCLICFIVTIVACHKENGGSSNPPPVSNSIKLKDVNVRNLPSPYYHFEYDDSGNISHVNFSADQRKYKVNYDAKNIVSMENTTDLTKNIALEYVYINGELVAVKVKDKNGVTIRHCILSFSPSKQLLQMDWDVKEGDVGYALEQTLTFSYYPDGNVKEITTHDYPVGSQTGATYSDKFENYDDHINADGFSLIHSNLHELVLLPGIKIQMNNPRRDIHTGDGINYEVNYSYAYATKGRPTIKMGDLLLTNTNPGQHYEIQSTFSYYD